MQEMHLTFYMKNTMSSAYVIILILVSRKLFNFATPINKSS